MVREPELVLMALAIGLYLYDSALLLYSNEGVLIARRAGWSVRFASAFRLARKELFLPSPLSPHRPLFRLAWNARSAAVDTEWSGRARLYRPLAAPVAGMALALYVMLPLGLFSFLGDRLILAALAVLYLNIVVALIWLTYRRSALGLTLRRLGALAFEALICPPFALNIVRKLSCDTPVAEDLADAARRLQSAADWNRTRAQLLNKVGQQLQEEDESSPRGVALRAYSQSLLHEKPTQPCLAQS
jgi:hypothetical protein